MDFPESKAFFINKSKDAKPENCHYPLAYTEKDENVTVNDISFRKQTGETSGSGGKCIVMAFSNDEGRIGTGPADDKKPVSDDLSGTPEGAIFEKITSTLRI